jgi:hypothetical protein
METFLPNQLIPPASKYLLQKKNARHTTGIFMNGHQVQEGTGN